MRISIPLRSKAGKQTVVSQSTHNEIVSFSGDGLSKSLELNQILGSNTLVSVRGPAGTPTLDACTGVQHFDDMLW